MVSVACHKMSSNFFNISGLLHRGYHCTITLFIRCVQNRFAPTSLVGYSRTGRCSKVVTLTLCPMPPCFPLPLSLLRARPPPPVQSAKEDFLAGKIMMIQSRKRNKTPPTTKTCRGRPDTSFPPKIGRYVYTYLSTSKSPRYYSVVGAFLGFYETGYLACQAK